MIYKPATGQIWDPWVIWHDGTYYAIMMHNPNGDFHQSSQGLMVTSRDGVHWENAYVAVDERARSHDQVFCKAFIAKARDGFFLNHGLAHDGINDGLRFYKSNDLRHWTHYADSAPDPRYYNVDGDVRWDSMYVLPKDENDPSAGYWGYVTACPKEPYTKGLGMMESADGLTWQPLPPPTIEWGDLPSANLEVGGCERIGGRYYLLCGWWRFLCEGYATYTFVADHPQGPFRPDRKAFRLCGSSTIPKALLACFVRGRNDELLVSNHMNSPSGVWMLPLRKATIADGHLRLVWWPENEALKGNSLNLQARQVELEAESGRQVAWIEAPFDFDQGIILEGRVVANSCTQAAAFVGFAFQEVVGITRELRIGLGESGQACTLAGRYTELFGFHEDDVAGPACATLTGIKAGEPHTFRLLVRQGMFELYVNDRLVRTTDWRPQPGHARLGLLMIHGTASFEYLKAFGMSFPASSSSDSQSQGLNPLI